MSLSVLENCIGLAHTAKRSSFSPYVGPLKNFSAGVSAFSTLCLVRKLLHNPNMCVSFVAFFARDSSSGDSL